MEIHDRYLTFYCARNKKWHLKNTILNLHLKNTFLICFLFSFYRHNLELQLNLEVIKKKAKKSSKDRSLIGNVFTPLYLLSLVVMCITQLRLLFFIGSLTSMLEGITGGDTDTGKYLRVKLEFKKKYFVIFFRATIPTKEIDT